LSSPSLALFPREGGSSDSSFFPLPHTTSQPFFSDGFSFPYRDRSKCLFLRPLTPTTITAVKSSFPSIRVRIACCSFLPRWTIMFQLPPQELIFPFSILPPPFFGSVPYLPCLGVDATTRLPFLTEMGRSPHRLFPSFSCSRTAVLFPPQLFLGHISVCFCSVPRQSVSRPLPHSWRSVECPCHR